MAKKRERDSLDLLQRLAHGTSLGKVFNRLGRLVLSETEGRTTESNLKNLSLTYQDQGGWGGGR